MGRATAGIGGAQPGGIRLAAAAPARRPGALDRQAWRGLSHSTSAVRPWTRGTSRRSPSRPRRPRSRALTSRPLAWPRLRLPSGAGQSWPTSRSVQRPPPTPSGSTELRLRTLEVRFDGELAVGRDTQLVAELRAVAGEHPYRERFVAQLMLALYRAGRHAEALEVYERTRRALADDLGLQPSAELQQLSGQMVRQEPHLRRSPASAGPERVPPHRARRVSGLVLGAAFAAAAVAFAASGSAPTTAAGAPLARALLVLPRSNEGGRDPVLDTYASVFSLAQFAQRPLKTTTLVVDDRDPSPEDLADAAETLRRSRFTLVMWVGDGAGARALAPLVRALPATRFVYLDASLETLALEGVPNATAVRFAEEQSSELMGYLSGLVAPRGGPTRRACGRGLGCRRHAYAEGEAHGCSLHPWGSPRAAECRGARRLFGRSVRPDAVRATGELADRSRFRRCLLTGRAMRVGRARSRAFSRRLVCGRRLDRASKYHA